MPTISRDNAWCYEWDVCRKDVDSGVPTPIAATSVVRAWLSTTNGGAAIDPGTVVVLARRQRELQRDARRLWWGLLDRTTLSAALAGVDEGATLYEVLEVDGVRAARALTVLGADGGGGGGGTPGPTTEVDLAPPTLLLIPGATGLVTATPRDAVGTATGDSVTYDSTNPSAATVNTSGLVTGVSEGAASITATAGGITSAPAVVTVVAPSTGEPAFTRAPNQTEILSTDLSEAHYASATSAGQYPYSGGDPAGPLRWTPFYSPANPAGGGIPVDTSKEEILHEAGGVNWLRMKWSGAGGESSNFYLSRLLPQTGVVTYGLAYYQRWNLTTGIPDPKNVLLHGQTVNPDDNGRLQIAVGPDGRWGVHDQVFTTDTNELASPFNSSMLGIANGFGHRIAMKWRWHGRSPGTVNRLVQVVNPGLGDPPTFNRSQAGVIRNGDRVLLMNNAGNAPASAAEFIVSNFDGTTRATLTRSTLITGSTVAYAGGIYFLPNVVWTGVFSTSQAGGVSNGDLLSMNNSQGMVPCIVSAFDGTTGCQLAQYNPNEVNLNVQDYGGLWFSRPSDRTGFLEYWVDGVKVIHLLAENIGVTPTGGVRPWCTSASHASFGVGASLSKVGFGNVCAFSSGPASMDVGRRIDLWSEP